MILCSIFARLVNLYWYIHVHFLTPDYDYVFRIMHIEKCAQAVSLLTTSFPTQLISELRDQLS